MEKLETILLFDGMLYSVITNYGSSAGSSPPSRVAVKFSCDEDNNDEEQTSDVQEPLPETKSTNPRKRRLSEPESASSRKRMFTELEGGEISVGELFAKSPAEQNDDGDDPPLEYTFDRSKPMAESDVATVWRGHRSTAKGIDYVVAKMLHHDTTSRTEVVQSFEHEVAILQGLDHVSFL